MAPDDSTQIAEPANVQNAAAEPTAPAPAPRKRIRLDLDAGAGAGKERRRGKSMFGLVLGTLNKAKIEDKERNASEAAKKRQLIEQRLQMKLRKETDSVRRVEEAKKDKTLANRKEEDLQLKDSIYKLRRRRLPILANFLLTSDVIPSDMSSPPPPSTNPLAPVPRTHPPPLYYLPAILTPSQEAFVSRRKAEVAEAAEKEWELFRQEREAGIVEIRKLREKVAEEEARSKAEREAMDTDAPAPEPTAPAEVKADELSSSLAEKAPQASQAVDMDVDDKPPQHPSEPPSTSEAEKKSETVPMQADDDDAVEY